MKKLNPFQRLNMLLHLIALGKWAFTGDNSTLMYVMAGTIIGSAMRWYTDKYLS